MEKQNTLGASPGTQNLETFSRKADIELDKYTFGEIVPYIRELRGLELALSGICDDPRQNQIIFFYESLGRLLDELENSITIKEVSNNE